MTDYAHNPVADANRREKARTLAAWCWDHHVTAVELDHLDRFTLNRVAREAGVNPPSTGETWQVVAAMLTAKTAWAAEHPDHPKAKRAGERPEWVRPAPPEYPEGTHVPKGWDTVVALGPLTRTDAVCSTCGAPPVVLTCQNGHCALHPPQPGQWGAHLDWTVKDGPCLPTRCYCGRCPSYKVPANAKRGPH